MGGDSVLRRGQELTANRPSAVSDSLTSGVTAPQPVISVSSAEVDQPVAGAAPPPGTAAAVSKVKVPDQAERSQGSFATLNKLLHSFTSGSPKALKPAAKKGSALTDAQVQHTFGYTTHAADLVTCYKSHAVGLQQKSIVYRETDMRHI